MTNVEYIHDGSKWICIITHKIKDKYPVSVKMEVEGGKSLQFKTLRSRLINDLCKVRFGTKLLTIGMKWDKAVAIVNEIMADLRADDWEDEQDFDEEFM